MHLTTGVAGFVLSRHLGGVGGLVTQAIGLHLGKCRIQSV